MKRLAAILLSAASAGCLTASNPTVSEWTVQVATLSMRADAPKFGVTRLAQVNVRAPYDVRTLAVLRDDYSLAFDPYNHFAALPSQLLKGTVQDVLAASGQFKAVVASTSAASVSHVVEVTVTNLRLNCATVDGETRRTAEAGVSVLVLNGAREIVGSVRGSGAADANDGDYGAAFSKAVTEALAKALGSL